MISQREPLLSPENIKDSNAMLGKGAEIPCQLVLLHIGLIVLELVGHWACDFDIESSSESKGIGGFCCIPQLMFWIIWHIEDES